MNKQPLRSADTPEFYEATDVARILRFSRASAYRLIKHLNEERKKQGKITFSGKILKTYFNERIS